MAIRFSEAVLSALPFEPTTGQWDAIVKIHQFLTAPQQDAIFILKGYAGTGKTSLIAALVKALQPTNFHTLLLAPTGRAAKVLSGYAGKVATTIHRKIYRYAPGEDGGGNFGLNANAMKNTLIIVDESSLIAYGNSGDDLFRNNVLEDLLQFTGMGENCRIMFCGDTAQLPPVGASFSPALDANFFSTHFHCTVFETTLTEVVRQEADSGILFNATRFRAILQEKEKKIRFQCKGFTDIVPITGFDLEDILNRSYSDFGEEQVAIICRSNKRALAFNKEVRNRLFFREELISNKDRLMVVRNNYFWTTPYEGLDFIANGDILDIVRIRKRGEERYGMSFADATVRLSEQNNAPEMEVKILLNLLDSEAAGLSKDDYKKFADAVMEDFDPALSRQQKLKLLKTDPYFNALQVKFAYAITCHKAQGGQWPVVFVDQGYLTDELVNDDLIRWFYTALTRASKQVYLVNFNPLFLED
jgi:exodeoxyribonuclease-5